MIVRGPDAYISPSWYADEARARPGRADVELRHRPRLRRPGRPRRPGLGRRARPPAHRPPRGRPRRAVVGRRRPGEFVAGQLRAIVGVELRITRIEAKFKLSQNRPAADVDGVVEGLRAAGDPESAAAGPHTVADPTVVIFGTSESRASRYGESRFSARRWIDPACTGATRRAPCGTAIPAVGGSRRPAPRPRSSRCRRPPACRRRPGSTAAPRTAALPGAAPRVRRPPTRT